jgi:transcription elongation factor GreA
MTQADERAAVWLTQAKFDELQAELEDLRGPGRAAVVQKVSEARDEGDINENGG